MSGFPSQNVQATYGDRLVAAQRVFKCLECQQYVVYASPKSLTMNCGIPAVDISNPDVESSSQSDPSQKSVSYAPYHTQLSPPNSMQSATSNLPEPVSLFPSDISQAPFPHVIDVSMADSCLDSYNSSYFPSVIETEFQNDTSILLRQEIDHLRDTVHSLQEKYRQLSSY